MSNIIFYHRNYRLMTVYQPTLKQLRYLVALDKANSFSKAAEACSVTQSTLSASIGELESTLGLKLAERSRKFHRLTDSGNEIVRRSRDILALTDDLMSFAATRHAPLTGRIRLGAIPTIGPFILPQLVSAVQARYPKLTLQLQEVQTDELLLMLAEGKLDAAIMAFPYPTSGLAVETLGLDRMRLLVSASDHFAKRRHIDAHELVGQNLLLLEDGHCLRDHVLGVCHLEGIKRPAGFEGTSLLTIALMVEMKLGFSLVPEMALKAGLLRGLEVATVPIGRKNEGRQIGLVWRQTSPRSEEFKLLASEAKKVLLKE
jgi:LysR family transcriptional regulator, hydrogen peroxide-inducible genes activator